MRGDGAARNVGVPKRLRTLPTITRDIILTVVASINKLGLSLSPDGR
jgi:putative RNA 2'-phosphotransferase